MSIADATRPTPGDRYALTRAELETMLGDVIDLFVENRERHEQPQPQARADAMTTVLEGYDATAPEAPHAAALAEALHTISTSIHAMAHPDFTLEECESPACTKARAALTAYETARRAGAGGVPS
jgi:hypothetical protein